MKSFVNRSLVVFSFGLSLPVFAQHQFKFATNNGAVTITKYLGVARSVTPPRATTSVTTNNTGGVTTSTIWRSGERANTVVSIPPMISGLPVVVVGQKSFYGCDHLASVEIPGSVDSIGDRAFGYCELTNLIIHRGVFTIGNAAFVSCGKLPSVTIPDGTISIGNNAFENCFALKQVFIPKSVRHIGDNAFSGCTSLQAITVDDQNSAYSSEDGVLFDKNRTILIQYPCSRLGTHPATNDTSAAGDKFGELVAGSSGVTYSFSNGKTTVARFPLPAGHYTIPKGVVNIKPLAFRGTSLESVGIPDSVTNIGAAVFFGCNNLTKVTIGKNVRNIETDAFKSCDSLLTVVFQGNAPHLESSIFTYSDKVTVYYPLETTGWSNVFDGRPTKLITPNRQ